MTSSVNSVGFVPPYIFKQLSKVDPSNRDIWKTCYQQTIDASKKRTLESFAQSKFGSSLTISPPQSYSPKVEVFPNDPNDMDAKNAANNGLTTLNFLWEKFKRASFDNKGTPLNIYVHDKSTQGNAQWKDNAVYVGDATGQEYTNLTSDIDIIAHEIGHGVVRHTTQFIYQGQSGALDESFADVLGSMVKQASQKQKASQADWLIGDKYIKDLPKGKVQALRSMQNPGNAYFFSNGSKDPQIGHMRDYGKVKLEKFDNKDNGGVHIYSGIPNKAFYQFSMAFPDHYSWEIAGRVWYKALDYCNANTNFSQFANATLQAVDNLEWKISVSDIKLSLSKAWSIVGVEHIQLMVQLDPIYPIISHPTFPDGQFLINNRGVEELQKPRRRSVQNRHPNNGCCVLV